jgi:DNA mismatch endonuclease (patch repair protein)
MRANRSRDTGPELTLRRLLHRRGLRYRAGLRLDLGVRKVRPDIVFTRARVAVFLDGCYWHRCPSHASFPTANAEYWRAKFDRTVSRDRADDAALNDAGWTVIRVWEHEDAEDAAIRIRTAVLRQGRQ